MRKGKMSVGALIWRGHMGVYGPSTAAITTRSRAVSVAVVTLVYAMTYPEVLGRLEQVERMYRRY